MAETLALNPSPSHDTHTLSKIRSRTQSIFGVRACLWQLKVTSALLKREKDVICIAGTGMGKTLTFWMPLLFRSDGIQIVVTPLNLLGKQNVVSLAKAGIRGIAINEETATTVNFQQIRTFQYRAIIVSPEQIMKPGSEFEKLLKDTVFVTRIISIVIDEAHCLTEWGEFRPEYQELGRLRYILPTDIPLLIASATLTKSTITDITHLLHMRMCKTIIIRRSSDRPNIKIGVRKIQHPMNTYADLAFLIPEGFKVGDPPPPKFLVFFDDISDSINAIIALRRRLPKVLWGKIKWFNAEMSKAYKEAEVDNLIGGDTWGLCTTSSFGMGMDVPDISVVVQWRATCSLASLWQRFGRAVRNKELVGTAILLAEKDYFDDERAAKEVRRVKRTVTPGKRKADEADLPAQSSRSSKRHMSSPSSSRASTSELRKSGGGVTMGSAEMDARNLRVLETVNAEPVHGELAADEGETQATGLEPGLRELTEAATKTQGRSFGHATHPPRRQKRTLEVAMDILINADNRPGVKCRRKVFDVCFDNAAADSDHLDCDTTASPNGCSRCHVTSPTTCCDIHNPTAFMLSALPSKPLSGTAPSHRRSRLPQYSKDEYDYKLDKALQDWREEKTINVYGWANLNDYGPSLVMTDSILDRLIDCAHHRKIQTAEDIRWETGWMDSGRYGGEITAIINANAAPSTTPFVSTPLRHGALLTRPTNIIAPAPIQSKLTGNGPQAEECPTTRPVRRNKCSACLEEGHNARNKACPKHPSRLGKENEPIHL